MDSLIFGGDEWLLAGYTMHNSFPVALSSSAFLLFLCFLRCLCLFLSPEWFLLHLLNRAPILRRSWAWAWKAELCFFFGTLNLMELFFSPNSFSCFSISVCVARFFFCESSTPSKVIFSVGCGSEIPMFHTFYYLSSFDFLVFLWGIAASSSYPIYEELKWLYLVSTRFSSALHFSIYCLLSYFMHFYRFNDTEVAGPSKVV